MWQTDNITQLLAFSYSILVGAVFCSIYDFLRAVRYNIHHSTLSVFIEDILYSSVCAVFTFCFLISVTGGDMRGYVFVGLILGFLIIRLTFSKILFYVFSKIIIILFYLYRKFIMLSAKFFDMINRVISFLTSKAFKLRIFFLNRLKKA